MKDSTAIFRVLSARRTSLSLITLIAIGGVAHAETLQDPTRPATAPEAVQEDVSSNTLRLEAIMNSGTRRIAIINGKVVRAGDRIGPALIGQITVDSVHYIRDGRMQVVRLPKTKLPIRQVVVAREDRS